MAHMFFVLYHILFFIMYSSAAIHSSSFYPSVGVYVYLIYIITIKIERQGELIGRIILAGDQRKKRSGEIRETKKQLKLVVWFEIVGRWTTFSLFTFGKRSMRII